MIRIELDFEQEDKIVVESLMKYYNSECNELTSGRDEALLAAIETVLDSYMSSSEYRAWKAGGVNAFKSIRKGLEEAIVHADSVVVSGTPG
jgi:predicted GTPase